MSFVIDGSEWRFDGWTSDAIDAALGALLERVTIARERRERVWIGDELQARAVLAGLSIWELWAPECPVDLAPELRQELAATKPKVDKARFCYNKKHEMQAQNRWP